MVPLSNTIPQYVFIKYHRYVSYIFVAIRDTNLRCRYNSIAMGNNVCFYPFLLVYHWLSTVNCKAVAIPDCLLPWHDCHFGVQCNTIAAWATIHSGFPVTPNQWKRERLNSEKCLEHLGYSSRRTREMRRTKGDQWCWAALRLCFNSSCYLSKSVLEILDILSYVFVYVDGVSD